MRFPARNPNRKAGDKKVFLSNRGEASRKELKHESFFIKRFFFLIFYFFFFFFTRGIIANQVIFLYQLSF